MESTIDWNLLRFMYEVHGASEVDLAEENGTTANMVNYVKEKQGWKRSKIAESVRDWTDSEDYNDAEMVESVQQRMSVSSLLKQVSTNTKLQIFETALINKAIDAVTFLDPSLPTATPLLCQLGTLLEKLKESNPALQAFNRKQDEPAGAGSIKVQIVTGYADNRQERIEVTTPPQLENRSAIPHSTEVLSA